jgi:tetratricopeptide (TPR) repeat protein
MKIFLFSIYFFVSSLNLFLYSQAKNEPLTPAQIIESYISLYNEKKFSERYEYIASISKEGASKDVYINFYDRDIKENIDNNYKIHVVKITEIETETRQSKFKRFKVDEYGSSNNGTVNLREYYTLINENGKWKIVWTRLMKSLADEKYFVFDYEKAIELYSKIIDLNPFDGYSYDKIAWCYYLNKNIDKETKKKEMFKNVKKAILFEPDMSEYYRTMSIYYRLEGLNELQLEYIQKAKDMALNESDKEIYYSDLAKYYITDDYTKSLDFINKAIDIDPENTYNWYLLGYIYFYDYKYEKAETAFEKALSFEKMDDYLQSYLYGYYARTCYFLNNYGDAKKYIIKALELDPTNQYWKDYYNELK